MLDAWIIEKIREREKEVDERPTLRLPVPENVPCQEDEKVVESDRGVIKINIYGDDNEEEANKT